MLKNETGRTAWYAEPYDDRLQHVLLEPLPSKDKPLCARPRPGRHRSPLGGRLRLALVVGLIVVAIFLATSAAHAQRNPCCDTATLEFSEIYLQLGTSGSRLDDETSIPLSPDS